MRLFVAGVESPTVVVKNSTSVDVYWKPPRLMNGRLLAYTLTVRDVGRQVIAYNGTGLFTTVETLLAGRTYNFVLRVSTNGGRTDSPAYQITMPVATPLNVPPPHTANVISATEMLVSWTPVTEDVIGQYRVLLNVGQDTEVTTGVGTASSVTLLSLEPYTLYEVRLQACLLGVENGCGTSDAVYNRTFEAAPSGQNPPTLTALSSDTVKIDWEGPRDPNGVILSFRIFQRAEGATDNEILINQVGGDIFSFTHGGQDLEPFTVYQYGIMAVNSQGQTEVNYAAVRTLQSPPTGLNPPTVTSRDAFSVVIHWDPPMELNGIISMYIVYYELVSVDSTVKSVTVSGNKLNTSISGLEPYSQYSLQLEALNAAGSVSSTEIVVPTEQASPSGLQLFSVEAVHTGTAVILRWDPPTNPNGIITSYRVYEMSDRANAIYRGVPRIFEFRRLQPYTEYLVQLEACTAAGCTIGEEQSIRTAEIAPSAQPTPSIGNVTSNSIVLKWYPPLKPNGRITAYEMYRRHSHPRIRRQATNLASAEELVFRTLDTNATSYEFTDSNLRPYTVYEYKIRVINSRGFSDSPWQTIQTTQAVPEGLSPPEVTFVENNVHVLNVSWSAPLSPNGLLQSYQLQLNNSIPLSLPADGVLHYVFEGLLPYTWYAFSVTACSGGGCITSEQTLVKTKESAPLSVNPPAVFPLDSTSIRVNWSAPAITNGEISLYQLSMDETVVYEGMHEEYSVVGLVPYQEYTFFLTACTRGGCTDSSVVTGHPNEAPPLNMNPPLLRVVSSSAIEISWSAPYYPNGVITSYDVRRDGNLIFTDSSSTDGVLATAYTDYELQPGEEYTYTVVARNSKGSVESPLSQAQTYETSPSGLEAPSLTPLSSTSIQVEWVPPLRPNGQIVNYTLYIGNSLVYSGPSNQLSYVVPGLSFFQQYTFRLQACTARGCQLSLPVSSQTLEAPPQQQAAPMLTALADGSGAHLAVYAIWRPPLQQNGNLLYYQLQRRFVITNEDGEYCACIKARLCSSW